jgi:GPI inositol-deacylase
LYKEGKENYEQLINNKYRTSGIPVLFVPGNAGDFKQARSLASVSSYFHRELQHHYGEEVSLPEYDFYTTDFKSELTGMNGFLLEEQTQFVNDCIRAIIRRYTHLPESQRPKSVLLVGHSMGGLIASAVFTQKNYHPNSVSTIITLNTPHNQHPFLYRRSIKAFYESLTQHLNQHSNTSSYHSHSHSHIMRSQKQTLTKS